MDLTTSMVPENIAAPASAIQDHRERAEAAQPAQRHVRTWPIFFRDGKPHQAIAACRASWRTNLFDIAREPQRIRDRYGNTLFGRQCLGGASAVRAGVPFIRVVGRGGIAMLRTRIASGDGPGNSIT